MLSPAPQVFTTKLGKTRAGESSRVWIEGQRLIAAGFIQGVRFEKDFDPATRTLYLTIITHEQLARNPLHEGGWEGVLLGTVSGKNGKPIIDVVGSRVIECFRSTHVHVTYRHGEITITAA